MSTASGTSVQQDSPADVLLRDPLSTETRNERKVLVAVAAVGILIAKTGLIPSKISALGIEFTSSNKDALLRAVAVAVLYFAIAFMIYALADFLVWRFNHRNARVAYFLTRADSSNMQDRIKLRTVSSLVGPTSLLRAFLEFLFPLILGIYSIICLLSVKT